MITATILCEFNLTWAKACQAHAFNVGDVFIFTLFFFQLLSRFLRLYNRPHCSQCRAQYNTVRPSVCHVPVLCPDE